MFSINPYLTFNGNCEETLNFYKTVFNKKFRHLGGFKNMPPQDEMSQVPKNEFEQVMHVSLPISNETTLMGYHNPSFSSQQTIAETNFAI